jgi:hypothetical protein
VAAVFFDISGHGFGHAAREMAAINALGVRLPDYEIVVRTSAPRWLFDQTVRVPIRFLEGEMDTGIVQIDSLRLDERATIARAAEFHRTLPARAAAEASSLRDHDARLAISDAPPLGCLAAASVRIPSVVLSNFTWDWIYEAYERQLAAAPDLLPAIRDAYAQATEAWRLPLHGGFAAIRRVIDVPFVARHARADRTPRDVRSDLSLPLDRPLALVSFGGYGVAGLRLGQLDCFDAAGIVVTAPAAQIESIDGPVLRIAEGVIYGHGLRYVVLIAAVDVVVTKPGYGIIADCDANQTAMLYTSRGRFAEYDVMVAEMPRFLRCEYLDLDSVLAGRWRNALTRLLRQPPPPEQPRTDGADVVADLIVERLAASRG